MKRSSYNILLIHFLCMFQLYNGLPAGKSGIDDWNIPPSRSEGTELNNQGSSEVMSSFMRLPEVMETEFSNATVIMKDKFKNVSATLEEKLENLHSQITQDINGVLSNLNISSTEANGIFGPFKAVSIYLYGLSQAFGDVFQTADEEKDTIRKFFKTH